MNFFTYVSCFCAVTADFVEQSGGRAGLEEAQSSSPQALTQARFDRTAQRDNSRAFFVDKLLRHTLLHDLLDFFFYVGNQPLLELYVGC